MSYEFFVHFRDKNWYLNNINTIKDKILTLETFHDRKGDIFELTRIKSEKEPSDWLFDVRIIFSNTEQILVEISARPKSIEKDLSFFFAWLRSLTTISIEDEDNVVSDW